MMNDTHGEITAAELETMRSNAGRCLTCGMLATVDPIAHAERFGHPATIADGSGRLVFSHGSLSWVAAEPEPEPEPGPVCTVADCYSCEQAGSEPRGPMRVTARGLMCSACAALADVIDDDGTGVKATLGRDRVVLTVDSTSGTGDSVWLTVPDVDALIMALLIKRQELAAANTEAWIYE